MAKAGLFKILFFVLILSFFPQLVSAKEMQVAMGLLAQSLAETLPAGIPRPLRVAVLDFEGAGSVRGLELADGMAGALPGVGGAFVVLERRRLLDALREQNLSMTDMVDPATAIGIGKIMAAQAIVYGRSTLRQQEESLMAWVMMVETGERLMAVSARVRHTRSAGYGGLRSAVFPGWGQWTCGKQGSGAAFMVSVAGLGSGAMYAQAKAQAARDDAFLVGTPAERDRFLGQERDWQSRRNWMLAGVGVAYVTNVLHAAWVSARTPIYADVRVGDGAMVVWHVGF